MLLRYLLSLLLMLASPAMAATYSFQSDSYSWETTTNNVVWDQTNTSYPRDDDKMVVNFTGGFSFTFGNVSYNSVRIISNGALQFGADSAFHQVYNNTSLPVSNHDRLILMYWDDINPRSGGTVKYEQKGTAPNRYFVVSWENVPHYSLAGTYSFQVILYENGDFKFQYGSGNAAGASATIGVEVNDSDYTLFSFNNAWGTSGTAIRWSKANTTPSVSAYYAFEDASWNGSSQEVYDRSGNKRHGTRIGNAQVTASGRVCQGASIPYNNSAAGIDAINTTFDLDATLGNKGSIDFWYKSTPAWSGSGAHAAQLFDATTINNSWFFLSKDSSGRLTLMLTDSSGTSVSTQTAANAISAGTWVHIAATWSLANGNNQSVLRIYLNGALAGSSNVTTSGTLSGNIGTLYLGDNRSNFVNASGSAISADGLLDEVQIYNYEINSAQIQADMADSHGCALDIRVGGFNAVDVGADAVSGRIGTKTSGSAFSLDLIALDASRTTIASGFSGSILVDLLANTTLDTALDANNCPISGTSLAVGTVTLSSSRSTQGFPAVADAWRDVRVRMRFPATGTATITACSTDNFAVKPAALSAIASHADWQTAGSGITLANTGATGGTVHKAGLPFSVRVTGYNAANVITSNYDGSPTASVACLLPASGCAVGQFSPGVLTPSAGTLVSDTASYSEVGAIALTFSDTTYASVDSGDTAASCTGFHVCASVINVGRFVPDHYDVTSLQAPAFQTFGSTCANRSFTYLGQDFGFATLPRARIIAKNSTGGTTRNARDTLWKLSPNGHFASAWRCQKQGGASCEDVSISAAGFSAGNLVANGDGSGDFTWPTNINIPNGVKYQFLRSAPAPSPFNAEIGLGIRIQDSSEAGGCGLASCVIRDSQAVGALTWSDTIAFDAGNTFRQGRLRLANAVGSELLPLPVPLSAQYWNGQGWVANTQDNCTSIASPSLTFFSQTADNQLAVGETVASFNATLIAGNGNLRFSAPGAGNFGFLDLSIAAPAWLRFNWDGVDQGSDGDLLDDAPRARAAFGKRRGRDKVIIRREMY